LIRSAWKLSVLIAQPLQFHYSAGRRRLSGTTFGTLKWFNTKLELFVVLDHVVVKGVGGIESIRES
jgi:hypothetical protein